MVDKLVLDYVDKMIARGAHIVRDSYCEEIIQMLIRYEIDFDYEVNHTSNEVCFFGIKPRKKMYQLSMSINGISEHWEIELDKIGYSKLVDRLVMLYDLLPEFAYSVVEVKW